MRITLTTVLATFAILLFASVDQAVAVDTSTGVGIPDYTANAPVIASSFIWFSSVEVGVCYSPAARLGSIKGTIHCTHQEKYDIDNNTWTLPQTCVALGPLGGPLSSGVRDACTNAKGTFNVITPAGANTDGSQAYNAIQQQSGGAGAGAGAGADDSGDTSTQSSGGPLSSLGKMVGF
ncbi:uncharacterized protein MEPE_01593 [Melanopsichium pennsylvanicum]|uniref:Pep1 n=2 Tax=Melanopsichium pennsylvanicum TaxID=63383 RepID=A0A0B5LBK2_9BASI